MPERYSGLEGRYKQHLNANVVFELTDDIVTRVLSEHKMFGFSDYLYDTSKGILEDTNIGFLPYTNLSMQSAHQDQYKYYACAYGLLGGLRGEQEEECRDLMCYALIGNMQGVPIEGCATEGFNKRKEEVQEVMNMLYQAGIAHISAARIVIDFCIALYTKPEQTKAERVADTLREEVETAKGMKAQRELVVALLMEQIVSAEAALRLGKVTMMEEATGSLRRMCRDTWDM